MKLKWIEWNGGECPVGPGELFGVRLRASEHATWVKADDYPESFRWSHVGDISDIVEYAVIDHE